MKKNRRRDSRKRVGRFSGDNNGTGRRGHYSMPTSVKEHIPLEKRNQSRLTNSHSMLTVNQQAINGNNAVRRGGSCVEQIKHRIWRLSLSIEEREREEHLLKETEEFGDVLEKTNPRSGLTRDQSIRARNNWRRIEQKANAKHRDALERDESMRSTVDDDNKGGGDNCAIAPLDEIPFVDLSPGRFSAALSAGRQPSQIQPSTTNAISTFPALPTTFSGLSPRLMVPAPIPVGITHQRHSSSQKDLSAPSKYPPPIPAPPPSRPSPALISTDSVPPALQLFLLPGNSQKDPKLNAAAVLDLKLRRRFAYEWEFLATVLDRLLLIVFAGLVLFVTGAMIGCGEIILRSYPTDSTEEN